MNCIFFRRKDERLAFFTQAELTAQENQKVILRLRTVDGVRYSACEGASIYIDGELQEGLVTDENGRVTLPTLAPRDTPYFITAKKNEAGGWEGKRRYFGGIQQADDNFC